MIVSIMQQYSGKVSSCLIGNMQFVGEAFVLGDVTELSVALSSVNNRCYYPIGYVQLPVSPHRQCGAFLELHDKQNNINCERSFSTCERSQFDLGLRHN